MAKKLTKKQKAEHYDTLSEEFKALKDELELRNQEDIEIYGKKVTRKEKAEFFDTASEQLNAIRDELEPRFQKYRKKDEEVKELNTKVSELSDWLEEERRTSEDLRVENNKKQSQIDEQETKKLAEAFEQGEKEYAEHESSWKDIVFLAIIGVVGVLSFMLISFELTQVSLETRINSISLSVLVVFVIWFCVKQYSFYRNLRVDMNHRKILAQSYYNILSSSEDEDVRSILAEKVVEFLVTPPHTKEDKMGTSLESIIKSASTIHGG